MGDMHFGMNGQAVCGTSRLLIGATTQDLQAVDCATCLWALWANGLDAIDKIALRIKLVTGSTAAQVKA